MHECHMRVDWAASLLIGVERTQFARAVRIEFDPEQTSMTHET